MDRWRKDIKRGYQSISNIYNDYDCGGKRLRYNTLTPLMQEVQQLGAKSDDICSILVEIMKDTKEKLIIAMGNGQSRAEQLEEASTSGTKAIHSPLKVRTKGRPPTKRKQSKVEQIVKKSFAKARKKNENSGRNCKYNDIEAVLLKEHGSFFASVTLDDISEVAASEVAGSTVLTNLCFVSADERMIALANCCLRSLDLHYRQNITDKATDSGRKQLKDKVTYSGRKQ
ncbi:hypothetical protein ZIOFF_060234 [Zingiber officinale]|uniref:Uncharacterized protein n=1 Tax=Zingiber officinale TaxID=94328 RepID=A0A8J5KHL1_ZINOF|nr:hypothetical protein ZIOFF_060234 [Zingiber officinale]